MPVYPALALLIGCVMAEAGGWKRIAFRSIGVIAGVAAMAIATILWHVWTLPTPGDISNALTQHPDAYTLSLGHMGDLTLESFAYLRMPLVLAGIAFRVAATLAVLLAAAAVVISDAPPMLAALAGLSAACYLVMRYTEAGRSGVIGASAPALLAALGFTFVGVLAASFPFELPWLPLLAPLTVLGIYVLATRQFYQAGEGKLELSSRS